MPETRGGRNYAAMAGIEISKKAAEAQRRNREKLRIGNDPRAKNAELLLERKFGYVGMTDAERIKKTWDHGNMPLYQTLKSLGKTECQ